MAIVAIEESKLTHHVGYNLISKKGTVAPGTITIDYFKGDLLKDLNSQTISMEGKMERMAERDTHTNTMSEAWKPFSA